MKFNKEPSLGGGGGHLKLAEGKPVVGIFRGDPLEFYSQWVGSKATVVPEGTSGARFRFKINFVTKAPDGSYVPLIWEQGPTVYNQLKELNVDYPLDTTVVKITRSGSTKDNTSYSILPVPNAKFTAQTEEALKLVKLNDLSVGGGQEEQFAPSAPPVANGAFNQHEEELPF